ncbi:MAG: thioredoxin domain-containing protein [Planctomycetota bacterium]|jgi:uncharacterized protein YyaL (SSP411 family)
MAEVYDDRFMRRFWLFGLVLLACEEKGSTVEELNRLAKEKSPYLRQHATNPVDWYPWGKEALEKAKKEDKPIFLSIGYSSCHWCHVMEHESFADEEVAKVLNKYFVCIKVDREERPDVDAIYMKAVSEVMGQQGGWPLSVWLTPDTNPFFGATYFRKPHFIQVLEQIAEKWADPEWRKKIEADSAAITDHLNRAYARSEEGDISPQIIELARYAAERSSDRQLGGWGGPQHAPKFPNPTVLELLLRFHLRHQDKDALVTAELALTKMALGGIHDHVGGGFHRYSTTRDWLVPHFEKMLYDNAQLLPLYAWAYRITGKELYRQTALDTARWVRREMTGELGEFFSAQDADDPGGPEHEGGFYVWTPEQVAELLDDAEVQAVLLYYDISGKGNWDHKPGKSILQVRSTLSAVAKDMKVSEDKVAELLASARARMYEAREKRPKPMTDRKALAGWSGLMISGFCRSWQLLGEKSHLDAAVRAGTFLRERMWVDGRLRRRYAEGEAAHDGVLDDYAWVVAAWLDLYESTFDEQWLKDAIALQAKGDELFFDRAGGGYFYTPRDGEKLIARGKDAFDHARPAGNAIMAHNLLRLMRFTGDLSYSERARKTFGAFGESAGRALFYYSALLNALDFAAEDTREIFVAEGEGFDELVTAVWRHPNRNRVLAKPTALLKPSQGKNAVDGKAAAYVCRNFTCLAPVTDPTKIDLTFDKPD